VLPHHNIKSRYRENIDMAFKWNRYPPFSLYAYVQPRSSIRPKLSSLCFHPIAPTGISVVKPIVYGNTRRRKNVTRVAVFGFGVPMLVCVSPFKQHPFCCCAVHVLPSPHASNDCMCRCVCHTAVCAGMLSSKRKWPRRISLPVASKSLTCPIIRCSVVPVSNKTSRFTPYYSLFTAHQAQGGCRRSCCAALEQPAGPAGSCAVPR
jgi:hypothetical protein